MGLDASLYKRKGDGKREEIAYWRKNGSLHQLMERIYRWGGGKAEMFNCIDLLLTKADLDEAIQEARNLRWHGYTNDVKLFRQAKKLINDGFSISYDSWW